MNNFNIFVFYLKFIIFLGQKFDTSTAFINQSLLYFSVLWISAIAV